MDSIKEVSSVETVCVDTRIYGHLWNGSGWGLLGSRIARLRVKGLCLVRLVWRLKGEY